MASRNPARLIGAHDRKGAVQRGMDADLILLDDEGEQSSVWCGGQSVSLT